MAGSDDRQKSGLVQAYAGKRCLVTGHTGFKGAWLSLWLRNLGAEVTGYALAEPVSEPSLFELAGIGRLVEDQRGDLRDYDRLLGVVKNAKPEIIFHLAAQPIVRRSYAAPKDTFEVNVGGTVNLLEAARAVDSIRAIVVITSDKCYENREWAYSYRESDRLGGHDPYSASKAAAEIVCAAYRSSFFEAAGVNLATVRAGNVIGGGDWAADRIIPDFMCAVTAGEAVKVRNPGATRPWQHVLDPLHGYLLLGACPFEAPGNSREPNRFSQAWNFGPSREGCRTVRELIEAFTGYYGSGSWNDMSEDGKAEPHEAHYLALATDKARHYLGWRPEWDFSQAVERTAGWYRKWAAGENPLELCRDDLARFVNQ